MSVKFPDNSENAPSEFTVVPEETVVPEGYFGMNFGGGRVVVMNEAALREQVANPQAFIEKVNPTGHSADVPFSEE